MKRHLAYCLVAAAASLGVPPGVRAEEKVPPRGYRYFTPARGSQTAYRYRPVSDTQPVRRQADEPALRPAPFYRAPLPPVGQQVVLRPASWGSRLAVAYVYPTAAYGQYVQAPGEPPADQAMTGSSPGYPSGINPYKYAYPPGGGAGYSYASVYSSGYYTSGCYQANACCRCCRRRCTLFGGMGYGCGPGCYTSIPAPCPTACAYGGYMMSPPAYGTPTPAPSTAPPTSVPPTPAPSTDDGAPPQPIEKKVTPAPQANLFPKIPGLPPDA